MKRRNRAVNRLLIILLSPAIIAIWMLGWTLFYIGSKQKIPRLTVTGDHCLNRLRQGAAGGKER